MVAERAPEGSDESWVDDRTGEVAGYLEERDFRKIELSSSVGSWNRAKKIADRSTHKKKSP
jgi:hypothetical protein